MPVGIERVVDEVAVELEDWAPVPELALEVVGADCEPAVAEVVEDGSLFARWDSVTYSRIFRTWVSGTGELTLTRPNCWTSAPPNPPPHRRRYPQQG